MNLAITIAVHIVLYTTILLINQQVDAQQIKKKQVINHKKEAIIRFMALLANLLMLKLLTPITWYLLFKIGFLECAIWWLVFDWNLNKILKMSRFYVGKTAEVDVFFRKLFPVYYEQAMLVTKIIVLLFSISLFIT